MCLRIYNFSKDGSHIKTATKDIKVFKVLLNTDYENMPDLAFGYLKTPYQRTEVASPLMRVKKFSYTKVSHWSPDEYKDVQKGIHSCRNLKRANKIKDGITYCGVGVVHKAIIPKGSKYILGDTDIVSLDLIIGEQL